MRGRLSAAATGQRKTGTELFAETRFAFGEREYRLERFPPLSDPTLRAWSAADEHLLRHLGDEDTPTLVMGDAFGAITVVLASRSERAQLVHWTDSHLAGLALDRNLAANDLDPARVERAISTSDPGAWAGAFGRAVLVIPKAVSLLEYQVEWLKPCLRPGAVVLAGGMTKHLSPRTRDLLELRVGPTEVSRVFRKSIVFRAAPDPEDLEVDEEALTPSWYALDGEVPSRVFAYPGVFSGHRMDRGTALLLEQLPEIDPGTRVLDLGCGSGVLSLALALREPGLDLVLVDESHLAAASARLTFEENGLAAPEIRVADGCEGMEAGSCDVVVSNPPFHAKHVLTVEEANRLFQPVKEVLRPGGAFFVVGAHGVDYGPTLRRIFGGATRLASDRTYSVYRCDKPPDSTAAS